MKRNLLSLLLALVLMFMLSAAATALADGYYYIDCDGSSVNMREGPSTDYDILCHVPFGAQVYVMDDGLVGSDFAHCTYNGYYGYISWAFLTQDSPVPGPTYGPIPTVSPTSKPIEVIDTKYVVTDNRGSVNIRSGPSTNYGVMAKAPYAAQVSVYSYSGSWANISYDGYYGYISTRYLSSTKPNTDATPAPAPVKTAAPAPTSAPTPVIDLTALFEGFVANPDSAVVAPASDSGIVHLRWAPSKDAPVIIDLEAGHALHTMYDNGTWALVYDEANDVCGFIMMEFLNYADGISG